jgi:hypothetical protein
MYEVHAWPGNGQEWRTVQIIRAERAATHDLSPILSGSPFKPVLNDHAIPVTVVSQRISTEPMYFSNKLVSSDPL